MVLGSAENQSGAAARLWNELHHLGRPGHAHVAQQDPVGLLRQIDRAVIDEV